MRYWCEDESRFTLHTIGGRKITATGVKPIGCVQWDTVGYYLYGLVEPKSGENFFYEFSHMDSTCFEIYLREFARCYPDDLHIIQLDNGPLHKAKKLQLPPNIVLFLQPSHSPELNPIERRLGSPQGPIEVGGVSRPQTLAITSQWTVEEFRTRSHYIIDRMGIYSRCLICSRYFVK